jgi:hypothetical protein
MSFPCVFIVQLNVDPAIEESWNHWYDTVHLPEVMAASPSILRATRLRRHAGTGEFQYCAIYEFADEAGMKEFMASDRLKQMSAEYTATYGQHSHRINHAYVPFKTIEKQAG